MKLAAVVGIFCRADVVGKLVVGEVSPRGYPVLVLQSWRWALTCLVELVHAHARKGAWNLALVGGVAHHERTSSMVAAIVAVWLRRNEGWGCRAGRPA